MYNCYKNGISKKISIRAIHLKYFNLWKKAVTNSI